MSVVAGNPPPNHSESRYMIAYVKDLCDSASENTVIKLLNGEIHLIGEVVSYTEVCSLSAVS
jgi:hypothetical protein